MTKLNIQIDDLVREMSEQEHKQYLAFQAEQAQIEANLKATIDARTSALAKLAALGLTEAEIAAL